MSKLYNVTINGIRETYEEGASFLEIARKHQKDYENDILLVMENHSLRELNSKLRKDCIVSFLTSADNDGAFTYRRSVTMLMLAAFYDILGAENIEYLRIHFSVSSGYFCTLKSATYKLNQDILNRVEAKMRQMIEEKTPFVKETIKTELAPEIFDRFGMKDKSALLKYRSASNTNIYRLGSFVDYFYGFMVPNASYLPYFSLHLYDDGFVIQMPNKNNPKTVPPFRPADNVYKALKESENWAAMMGANNVGELNDIIVRGAYTELILVQEALQEAKIASIAEQIKTLKNKRFIMIAGPSSSGKTTFSKRLCVQLLAHGLKPHAISVDNYYVERSKTPLDENGNYDFENITAIDLELLNHDMQALMNGEEIKTPTFNFVTGLREYTGETIKLKENDVLVIEGIHCLNDEMSKLIPNEAKFKIYISALMMLNLDEHNRISTTDGRLIRRMVRDARTRGKDPAGTIEMWDMVRKGEEKFIFPYQDQADVVFNSSMIHELFIMRQYARPLLLGIPKIAPEYSEAKRLLKFFDYIVDIPDDSVPSNSILREFIGGGCFKI